MYPPAFMRVLYALALVALLVLSLDLYVWRP